MLFGPNIRYFNELEINGKSVDDSDNEDYTRYQSEPDDEPEEVDAEDETSETNDDAIDYTDEDFDSEEDVMDDDITDYTDEDFDDGSEDDTDIDETSDDNETADEDFDDGSEDDTDAEGAETEEIDTEDETSEDNADATDDITDYTDEDFDDGSEDDDTDAEGADADSGDTETDEEPAENAKSKESVNNKNAKDDSGGDNTLADMEKNLFSDLSSQQLAIKNNELLQNYIELYETINTIFDNVNKIPKTIDNTRALTFIADQLVELKDMVNYIITTTYITRTYVENMTYYKQALMVLQQLNTMLKALIQKPTK